MKENDRMGKDKEVWRRGVWMAIWGWVQSIMIFNSHVNIPKSIQHGSGPKKLCSSNNSFS